MQQGMQEAMQPAMQPGPDVVGDESPEAQEGRGGDTILAHLTPGEVIIPVEMIQSPKDLSVIKKLFDRHNVDMQTFTAGHEKNNINPETGHPEFGFFDFITKPLKKLVNKVTDDILGFDPGGGGIYDVPVIGDAIGAVATSPVGAVLPGFITGGAQTKIARQYLQADIAKQQAKFDAQMKAYMANVDKQVKASREEGAATLSKMKAAGNVSRLQFEGLVKQRMKAEEESLSGAGGKAGATDVGGVQKGQAKFKKRKRRVKRAIQQGGRPE